MVTMAHLGCISLFLLSGLRYARSDADATSGAAPENETAGVALFENANTLHIETKGRQGDVLVDGQSLTALFAAVQTCKTDTAALAAKLEQDRTATEARVDAVLQELGDAKAEIQRLKTHDVFITSTTATTTTATTTTATTTTATTTTATATTTTTGTSTTMTTTTTTITTTTKPTIGKMTFASAKRITEGAYQPGDSTAPPVFKLAGRQLPSGSDARLWYQQQCSRVGLRPVQCGGTVTGTNYDKAGTIYDFRAFGAVRLPYAMYSCNVSGRIMQLTGWKNVATFLDTGYLNAVNKGLCMNGCTAYPSGTPVHLICTL